MKEDIKNKWVTALRSGDYEQGKEALRTIDDKFCCLGVLCNLYKIDTGAGEWKEESHYYSFDGEPAYLMDEVKQWSGIKHMDGQYTYDYSGSKISASLASLNDEGMPFTEIADIIEKNWEEL